MTPVRESFVLPGLFLSVTLLGGVRIAGQLRLVPPPLIALVLGLLLVGILTRAGVIAPDRLMNQQRNGLENVSGVVVLLSLFAASAQVFNLLTPETGVLHFLFGAFFLVQLLTTLAAVGERAPLLRSLAVLFGATFVLRFVVLESVYSPGGGMLTRLVTTLMEGVTLGALGYTSHAPATGYVAFLTLVLYMIGLVLLPAPGANQFRGAHLPVRAPGREILLLCILCGACGGSPIESAGVTPENPDHVAPVPVHRAVAIRDEALSAARVWRPPPVPISEARLGENPPGPDSLRADGTLRCRFVLAAVGGTTPKFDCELPDGEIVKIKYGRANAEIYTEVAATRLVAALGFGADRMYVVDKVLCAGCPVFPFAALRCHALTGLRRPCLSGSSPDSAVELGRAVVERRMDGRAIESHEDQGWAWYELDRVDATKGGATAPELDALRLLAVLLAHWDNKAQNQRLLCLPGGDRPDGSCAAPFAIMQDLGGTFGPLKLDLPNWRHTAVWADAGSCRVSMTHLPWGGATFSDRHISEEGRTFLLALLEQVSHEQLVALFTGARFTAFDAVVAESRSAAAWADVFQHKVQQIREAGRCPSTATLTRVRGQ